MRHAPETCIVQQDTAASRSTTHDIANAPDTRQNAQRITHTIEGHPRRQIKATHRTEAGSAFLSLSAARALVAVPPFLCSLFLSPVSLSIGGGILTATISTNSSIFPVSGHAHRTRHSVLLFCPSVFRASLFIYPPLVDRDMAYPQHKSTQIPPALFVPFSLFKNCTNQDPHPRLST